MKNVEIPKWLEELPLAPEFHPTDTEFADPIAYISKIEKEASAFGICKVIPPLPKPSRKYVLHNLNNSLSKCPELGSDVNINGIVNKGDSGAVFTTRQQELGCEKAKKVKGVVVDQSPGAKKQVWQSGEVYTLEQFELKSKNFARSQLGTSKDVNPLVVESLFWKAAFEKPIYIEYANDVPGSGFSEPEGSSHNFHKHKRRRRKRNSFDPNNVETSDSKNNPQMPENVRNDSILRTEIASNSSVSSSGQMDLKDSSNEMEGSSGWKLSNSPWNLQVIARSPGSLTRFMPDDIPGVTSPMVYIGMLFSWFAWHVEDHELHSLNYLHMGSPKTWYAVPGDYAFNFEEAIRLHVYGGNKDRLAALSLLGEKTTVLSPEVIVASGIPCCRLVQNPGEFVVTFPRAYHIGYSHGFNCGEAANFGTPKWLSIAKEAAVRRAAMNFLPMLSHQQLLYLLTMSFISRIPRSLLPGVRSSRLRDRQKDERELLVKKAFIEDVLQENTLLTILLQRNHSYRAVLWDSESLPSSSKESKFCSDSKYSSAEKQSLVNEDSLDHINAVGFDLNDDDLPYDFRIDSGSLPCVACGILGFPFMAIVQPSEEPSKNLLLEDSVSDQEVLKSDDANYKAKSEEKNLSHTMETHSSEVVSSTVEISNGWNISDVYLKPRIFCLEHAIEIEELLRSKGGANVLVICHSDFQKIKPHNASTAEEIATPFRFNEVSLDNASQEDLNLIGIAIDTEEQSAVEWTSQLSINLRHCVKNNMNFPSKEVQRLLTLGRLFCDAPPNSKPSSLNWPSRKLRSRRNLKHLQQSKDRFELTGEDLVRNLEVEVVKKEVQLIQYSRKRYKVNASADKNNSVMVEILDKQNKDAETSITLSNGMIVKGKVDISLHDSREHKIEISDGDDLTKQSYQESYTCTEKNNPVMLEILETRNEDAQISICPTNEVTVKAKIRISLHDSGEREIEESYRDDMKIQSDEDSDTCVDKNNPIIPEIFDALNEDAQTSIFPSNKAIVKGKVGISSHNSNEHGVDLSDGNDATRQFPKAQHEIQIEEHNNSSENGEIKELDDSNPTESKSESISKNGSKRKSDATLDEKEENCLSAGFIKSPCEGLRPRTRKDDRKPLEQKPALKKSRNSVPLKSTQKNEKGRYKCDLESCPMSFPTKAKLLLHEGNRCPVQGCNKKFTSHKYAITHQRVHDDDRPLKCPWKGCTMSFKWSWARTEHLRVHTGEKPYLCKVKGCGLAFRFVSDFSRHRRKTGHCVEAAAT